jgi:hypothetical protein
MDGEHLPPVGKGKLLDRMHDLDPGIRHENIDPAERLYRLLDAGVDFVLLRDVHPDADRRLLARQLLGCRLRTVGVQIGDDHPAVCLQIALGDGMTDAAGGSGDESHFAIKVHNSSFSSDGARGRRWRASSVRDTSDFRQ